MWLTRAFEPRCTLYDCSGNQSGKIARILLVLYGLVCKWNDFMMGFTLSVQGRISLFQYTPVHELRSSVHHCTETHSRPSPTRVAASGSMPVTYQCPTVK